MLKVAIRNINFQKPKNSNTKNGFGKNHLQSNINMKQDTVSFGRNMLCATGTNPMSLDALNRLDKNLAINYLKLNKSIVKEAYNFLTALNTSINQSWIRGEDQTENAKIIMQQKSKPEEIHMDIISAYSLDQSINIFNEIDGNEYKKSLCEMLLSVNKNMNNNAVIMSYDNMMKFLQSDKVQEFGENFGIYRNFLKENMNNQERISSFIENPEFTLLTKTIKLDKANSNYNKYAMKIFDICKKIYPSEKMQTVLNSEESKQALNNIYDTTNNENGFFRIAFMNMLQNTTSSKNPVIFHYDIGKRANIETINKIFQKADNSNDVKVFINTLMTDKRTLPYISPKDMLEYIENIDVKEMNKHPELFNEIAKSKDLLGPRFRVAYNDILNDYSNKHAINIINSKLYNISQNKEKGFWGTVKKLFSFFSRKKENSPIEYKPYQGSELIRYSTEKDKEAYFNAICEKGNPFFAKGWENVQLKQSLKPKETVKFEPEPEVAVIPQITEIEPQTVETKTEPTIVNKAEEIKTESAPVINTNEEPSKEPQIIINEIEEPKSETAIQPYDLGIYNAYQTQQREIFNLFQPKKSAEQPLLLLPPYQPENNSPVKIKRSINNSRKLEVQKETKDIINQFLPKSDNQKQEKTYTKYATKTRLSLLPDIFASIEATKGTRKHQALALYKKIDTSNKSLVKRLLNMKDSEGNRIYNVNQIKDILDDEQLIKMLKEKSAGKKTHSFKEALDYSIELLNK